MNEYGVAIDTATVRMERTLPASIDQVWTYLTDPDKRGTWLTSGPMELKIGGQGSEVRFKLKPQGDKTLLTLTHSKLPNRKEMVNVSGGWHTHLGILEDRLGEQQPRLFWDTFLKMETEYQTRIPQDPGAPG